MNLFTRTLSEKYLITFIKHDHEQRLQTIGKKTKAVNNPSDWIIFSKEIPHDD